MREERRSSHLYQQLHVNTAMWHCSETRPRAGTLSNPEQKVKGGLHAGSDAGLNYCRSHNGLESLGSCGFSIESHFQCQIVRAVATSVVLHLSQISV